MIKTATTLFDFAEGIKEPPSDPVHVAVVRVKFSDAIRQLGSLDPESKLELVRFIVKGLNGTSKEFNVAVFVVEKEEATPEFPLPDAEPKTEIDLFT